MARVWATMAITTRRERYNDDNFDDKREIRVDDERKGGLKE